MKKIKSIFENSHFIINYHHVGIGDSKVAHIYCHDIIDAFNRLIEEERYNRNIFIDSIVES